MSKRVWAYTLILLPVLSAGLRAQEAPPGDAVRAMLERSRQLAAVRFEVPTPLWKRYVLETSPPDISLPAPVPFIAEEAVYRLILPDGGRPELLVSLRLRIFSPADCRRLPILSAAWAWQNITANGRPAATTIQGDWLTFSPTQAGLLELSARVELKPAMLEPGSLQLAIPRTTRTLVRFDASGAWELEVGSDPIRLRGTPGAPTHGQLTLSSRAQLELTWRPPVEVIERPPRFELSGVTVWNLDTATQQVTADLEVAIVGGSTDQIDLVLLQAVERISVTGPDVREARVAGDQVTVFLRGRTAEKTHLRLAWESGFAATGLKSLQSIAIRDGHWSSGALVISNSAGNAEVLAENITGLEQIALADMPSQARALLAGAPVLAYTTSSRQFSAQVDVVNLGEFALRESIADLAHFETTFLEDGTLMTRARYEVRNRNKQFLRLELPRGARMLTARINEKTVPLSPVEEAADTYLMPLIRSTSSVKGLVSFPIEIVFVSRTGALERRGKAILPLPHIDLPIAYAWCNAYVPATMKVVEWRGPLKQVEKYSSETATESLGYGLGMAAEGYTGMAGPEKPLLAREAGNTVAGTTEVTVAGIDNVYDAARPAARPAAHGGAPVPAPAAAAGARRAPALAGPAGGAAPVTTPALPESRRAAALKPRPEDYPVAIEVIEEVPMIKQDSSGLGMTWRPDRGTSRGTYIDGKKIRSVFSRIVKRPQPVPVEAAPPPPPDPQQATLSLARNYYRAGKDSYERGDLAGAAKNLEQSVKLAPGSSEPEISNAARLLDNIQLAQGKLNLNSRAEKAAGAQVQWELKAGNSALEQQQQEHLERGLEASRSGREDEARVQLQAAEELSKQLVLQGADKREQAAMLRSGHVELDRLQAADQSRAMDLEKEVQDLKEEGRYDDALKSAQKLQKIKSASVGFGSGRAGGSAGGSAGGIGSGGGSGGASGGASAKTEAVRHEIDGLTVLAVKSRGAGSAGKGKKNAGPVNRAPSAPEQPVIANTYDVADLVGGDEAEGKKLLEMVQALSADTGSGGEAAPAKIVLEDGRLTVSESPVVQGQVRELLDELAVARGPQVEVGGRIAQQQAQGLVSLDSDARGGSSNAVSNDDEDRFRQFVTRNYDWKLQSGPANGADSKPTTPAELIRDLRGKLDLNLGQKVDVTSVRIDLDASAANQIGLTFLTGRNGLRSAIADEAQLRTLLELAARRGQGLAAPQQLQEALVGSEVLLADRQVARVRFAGEHENRLEVAGNLLELPHEHYLLIDDRGTLTAVRVGEMQHWSRRAAPVQFAAVPQGLELPRVGRLIKFEKTLLEPGDDLAIQATYSWKGGSK